jgi:hypothetical protein
MEKYFSKNSLKREPISNIILQRPRLGKRTMIKQKNKVHVKEQVEKHVKKKLESKMKES